MVPVLQLHDDDVAVSHDHQIKLTLLALRIDEPESCIPFPREHAVAPELVLKLIPYRPASCLGLAIRLGIRERRPDFFDCFNLLFLKTAVPNFDVQSDSLYAMTE